MAKAVSVATASPARPAGDLIPLADRAAIDPDVVGAKAAALAAAASRRLPVLPGYVISTMDSLRIAESPDAIDDDLARTLKAVWIELTSDGKRPLVVRSSSTAEDGSDSSMAGMFTSVLDVISWDGFLQAIREVVSSSGIVLADGNRSPAPMAVLIQPQLDAARGGILFGIDPITGDASRYSVAVTEGGPDALVSGLIDGAHLLMSHTGRVLEQDDDARKLLTWRDRRSLARLAGHAAEHFGGPQDIEWAFDGKGRLFLFQSRPVTAVAAIAGGPILGPGPVAETFPDPLGPLEEDLWIEPLRTAVTHALQIAGSATRRAIARSPVVKCVGGRVAADLELFGIRTQRKSMLDRLDPRDPARKMLAAWRVGRLKAALPLLTRSVAERIDEELHAVRHPKTLSGQELLNLLDRGRAALVSLHGYEILSGLLDDRDRGHMTAAELGLRALTCARNEGLSDRAAIAASPEVMALTPPSIGRDIELPGTSTLVMGEPRDAGELGSREAMRLRARWVQEVMARAARELGERMENEGRLGSAGQVELLTMDELRAVVEQGRTPEDLDLRVVPSSPPLPGMFRLAAGMPVPIAGLGNGGGAKGAGGGRGMGKVHRGRDPQEGEVLVVGTLDPTLAPLLPRLGGLVAETGNALSHLAILAREFGVPTVVGSEGALERFLEGAVVIVDGTTGEVSEVAEA